MWILFIAAINLLISIIKLTGYYSLENMDKRGVS